MMVLPRDRRFPTMLLPRRSWPPALVSDPESCVSIAGARVILALVTLARAVLTARSGSRCDAAVVTACSCEGVLFVVRILHWDEDAEGPYAEVVRRLGRSGTLHAECWTAVVIQGLPCVPFSDAALEQAAALVKKCGTLSVSTRGFVHARARHVARTGANAMHYRGGCRGRSCIRSQLGTGESPGL
jgi:hypothetical protein